MTNTYREIATEISASNALQPQRYTVCTLVTDLSLYEVMLSSFKANSFKNSNTLFLFVDNTKRNNLDAFDAIREFIQVSNSEYVIYCHQDVEVLSDGKDKLDELIEEVTRLDPNWAILGNAGGVSFGKVAIRISDPHGENRRIGPFPRKVVSLDENFLVIRKRYHCGLTQGMTGFHFYGTDLCLRAIEAGYSCYVIDFHLLHKGLGRVDKEFLIARNNYIRILQNIVRPFWVQTTCACFTTSRIWLAGRLLNNISVQRILRKCRRQLGKYFGWR